MDEFASAVLMDAVRLALVQEGIVVEAPRSNGALVPLAAKRRLLADIAGRYGLTPLLRVGRILPELPPNPALVALTSARDPADLLTRWSRLERFTHSSHRVIVREEGTNGLLVEHVGLKGSTPEAFEDAVILGVLTALVEGTGAEGLEVVLDDTAAPVFSSGTFLQPLDCRRLSRWRFAWRSLAKRSDGCGQAPAAESLCGRVRGLIAADPGRRWTLEAVAIALTTSSRTLQRGLGAEGGFSGIQAAVRAEHAAELLIKSRHPLSIVGFAAGYADQSHFAREFKRRTAMTPASYRVAFSHAH